MEEDEDAENFYFSFSYPSSPRSLQLFFARSAAHLAESSFTALPASCHREARWAEKSTRMGAMCDRYYGYGNVSSSLRMVYALIMFCRYFCQWFNKFRCLPHVIGMRTYRTRRIEIVIEYFMFIFHLTKLFSFAYPLPYAGCDVTQCTS